jgi:hypothetical protein
LSYEKPEKEGGSPETAFLEATYEKQMEPT